MSGHYTDGRRWSYISKAWIFADGWNDREEIARLEATLRQVEEERDEWKKALHILTPGGSEFANDPSACVEWIRKARSSQHNTILALKGERDQARADTQSLRELVGQWIWAMYLTPESYECRTIETYRQAVEARVRQLEELVQAELPPPLRRLEQQELLRLRAWAGELEESLQALVAEIMHITFRTCAHRYICGGVDVVDTLDTLLVKAQRALEGKEESRGVE